MNQAIDELKAIPGVVGACLFSQQDGLLQNNLPGIFKPDRLAAMGKQLVKLVTAGRMSFSDLADLMLHYDESVLVARELSKGQVVIAVCDPSFNQNLLTMSLNLLQEEWREQPGDAGTAGSAAAAVAPASAAVAAELEPVLDGMKDALAKVLGPMAGIIFDECRQQWAQQGGSAGRLPDLLQLLNREIDDPEKIAKFEILTVPFLAGRGS